MTGFFSHLAYACVKELVRTRLGLGTWGMMSLISFMTCSIPWWDCIFYVKCDMM